MVPPARGTADTPRCALPTTESDRGASLATTALLTRHRFASLSFCLLLLSNVPAAAQTESPAKTNRFALGGEFKIKTSDRASQEDYARGQLGPGLLWRFGHSKPGWGFHWGLNWYAVKLERPIGGSVTELGELHLRPVMAGYGYTRIIRRYSITADVLGGYAFGTMDISDPAIAAYRRTFGVPSAYATATNTLVLKPEIGVWYDLTRKVYINLNAGYMLARPDVLIETTAGVDRRKARADQFVVKVGMVYSIF
jgi:hypothetical protein